MRRSNKRTRNNLGRGQFFNAAQRDAFSQAALGAQFANAAQAQDFSQNQSIFNAQNVLRSQYIAEQYAQRNQPINEITSLLNGSQVMNPSFLNTPSNQIANTDVAGIINNRFSSRHGYLSAAKPTIQQFDGRHFWHDGRADASV